MDDFAVDLDKVLDDFELSEDGGGSSAPCPENNGNHAGTNLTSNPPGSGIGALCTQQVAPLESNYQPNNVNNQNYGRGPGLPAQINQSYQSPQKMECMVSPSHNANVHETNYVNTCNKVPSRSPGEVITMSEPVNQGQIEGSFYDSQPQVSGQQEAWVVQHNNPMPYNVNLISEGGVMAHGEQINGALMRRLSNDRPELLQSMAEENTPLPLYPGDMPSVHTCGQVVSRIHPDVVPTSVKNDIDSSNHRLPNEIQNNEDAGASPEFVKAHRDSPSSTPTPPSQISTFSNGDSSECEHPMSPQDNRQCSISPEPASNNVTEAMHIDSPSESFREPSDNLERDSGNAPSEPNIEGGVPMFGSEADISKESASSKQEQNMQSDCDTAASLSDDITGFPTPSLHRQPDTEIGFGFIQRQENDEDQDEMDAYLADIEKMEKEPEQNKEGSYQPNAMNTMFSGTTGLESALSRVSQIHNDKSEDSKAVIPAAEEEPSLHPPEQCDSGISLERILMPDIMSPMIATPMDDAGFTKVPGYKPPNTLTSLQEACLQETEEEEVEEVQDSGRNATVDLRTRSDRENQQDYGMNNSLSSSENVSASALMSETPGSVAQTVSVCSTVGQVQAPDQKLLTNLPQAVQTSEILMGNVPSSTQSASGAVPQNLPVKEKALEAKPVTNFGIADISVPMAGAGARPKEMVPQGRKSRPNSLIGLSKPDLNIAVPVVTADNSLCSKFPMPSSGVSGTVGIGGVGIVPGNSDATVAKSVFQENTPETLKSKSSQQKMHLDLDINQQTDLTKPSAVQSDPAATVPARHQDAQYGIGVMTNRAQLASGIDINLPREAIPTQAGSRVTQESESSIPCSTQHNAMAETSPYPHPQQIPVTHHSSTEIDKGIQQQQQQQQQQQLQVAQTHRVIPGAPGEAHDESSENETSKLKRPTSLSLKPRDEFSLARDKDSVDDDSATGEDLGLASSGSSGGQGTPYQTDDEMSEPPGAMASGPDLDIMYSPPEVGPGAFSPAPPCSTNVNMVITQLGKVAPRWVPDSEALNCMQCEARFTFTKRRHHCRACGKVFCSTCCNLKCKLQYMDNKEARVCSKCYQDIIRAQAYERMHSPSRAPNPNNPAEYCSTIPPLQQAAASLNAPPPTVMVPIGVLRKEGSQRNREPKQVMFSDGIRPGGDLTELDNSDMRVPIRRHTRTSKKVERSSPSSEASSDGQTKSPSPKTRTKRTTQPRNACLIPETGLPPVVMSTGTKGDLTLEENPNPDAMMAKIKSTEDPNPVVFAINRNLFVLVKILNLECCVNRICWCFSTRGMCTVGQEEIVVVLECLPDEKTIPRDIFCHLNSVYDEANKGNTVSHLGHTIFGQSFLDSRDHCGFLYVRPTFQCVQKLLLPSPPYVFGLLLQKWETPWAKVFPIRLMLRLGAEYRYYPCPLVSVRFRKPVFGEIGHTIMNLLADFRNYQYMLPQIRGVIIHMEEKKTFINFPRNRYDEIMKVITNSNDHVMALGANFSTDADSHLVCIQNEDGNYQTQAINIQNKPRKVTGASFVVFNGALKTSSGLRAKSSIVEDGLMVQITNDSMAALKAALLDMRDYTIGCGAIDAPAPDEQIIVQWVEDDHKINIGVKSPIDGRPMDGIESIHIHNSTDYVGESRTIRWTEVFFIQNEDASNSRCEPVDLSRLAETLAQACCIALTPKLDKLKEAGLTKIGLRCTIDRDNVGYEVGSMNERLPDFYMNDLDNELIPVIHNAGSHSQDGPVVLELIFHIIE